MMSDGLVFVCTQAPYLIYVEVLESSSPDSSPNPSKRLDSTSLRQTRYVGIDLLFISASLKGLKIATHASGQEKCGNSREKYSGTDLGHLQARQK